VTDAGAPQTAAGFDVSAMHMAKPSVTINSTADIDRLGRTHRSTPSSTSLARRPKTMRLLATR